MAKAKGFFKKAAQVLSPAYAAYSAAQGNQNKSNAPVPNQADIMQQQNQIQPFAPGWSPQQGGVQGPQVFPVDAQKHWFTGTEPYTLRTPIYGQQQGAGFSQALQMALQGLQNNPLNFAPIAQQARENFAQQTLPSIAERFSGLGAQKSSAFGQQLGQAGAGLESSLAGQQSQYGLDSNRLLQNLLSIGLTPQYETSYSGGREGEGSKALNSAIQGLIRMLGMAAGG